MDGKSAVGEIPDLAVHIDAEAGTLRQGLNRNGRSAAVHHGIFKAEDLAAWDSALNNIRKSLSDHDK